MDESSATGAPIPNLENRHFLRQDVDRCLALAGTATIDDDYTIVDEDGNDVSDGSVVIAAGDSYVDVTIKPVNNSVDADDKTVKLTLSSGSSYTIDDDAGDDTITIADDDTSSSALPKKKK